jgi:hypothetical protein
MERIFEGSDGIILWNTFFQNFQWGIKFSRLNDVYVYRNNFISGYVCFSWLAIFAKLQTYRGIRLLVINEALIWIKKMMLLRKEVSLKMSLKIMPAKKSTETA